MGGVGSGRRKTVTPEHRARLAENAKRGRAARAAGRNLGRDVLIEGKHQLRLAIGKHGIPDIVKILEAGPYALVEVEGKDGQPRIIELNEERSRLWQFAMNYAADRGGLPRTTELDVQAAEGIMPVEVHFKNFPRPADS